MSHYWKTHSLSLHRSAATNYLAVRVLSLCPPAEDKGQRWREKERREMSERGNGVNVTGQEKRIGDTDQRQKEESAGNKTHPLRLNYCRGSFRGSQSPLESSRGSRGVRYAPHPPFHPIEILLEAQTTGRLWRKDLRGQSPAITSNAIMSHYWETHSLPVHRSAATNCCLKSAARVLSLCPAGRGQRTAMGGCIFRKE
ncbi:hypothetical protein CEXT_785591 [Caerostris extrusa]|uniref:Uncharacterized protein n=1 Tax=Caerostris extrusa TaxID=172846 RepID=A0AAV4MIG6_CAEEX|nr:hypothetical protein CEXT_785591 [Caerostris extrusa]